MRVLHCPILGHACLIAIMTLVAGCERGQCQHWSERETWIFSGELIDVRGGTAWLPCFLESSQKGRKKQGGLDGSVCVEEIESHRYVCAD